MPINIYHFFQATIMLWYTIHKYAIMLRASGQILSQIRYFFERICPEARKN